VRSMVPMRVRASGVGATHEPDGERTLTSALSHPLRRRRSAASPMGEGETCPAFSAVACCSRSMVPMHARRWKEALNRARPRPRHDLSCVLFLQKLHPGKLLIALAITLQLLFSWLSAQAAPKTVANAPAKLKLEETPLSRDIKAPISFAPVAKK